MTDDLDARWADALRAHADQARPDPTAWAAVRERADAPAALEAERTPGGRRRILAVAAAVAVVGLGVGVLAVMASHRDDGRQPVIAATTTAPPDPSAPRYWATATVLEQTGPTPSGGPHGPELCLGGVLDSLPPQCGGPAITNWDWEEAGRYERRNGTTWGEYHVVGTFDGERFTLTDRPTAPPRGGLAPEGGNDTPCDAPPGGWTVVDPTKVSDADFARARAEARKAPDYASERYSPVSDDPRKEPFTFAFTGETAPHVAALRELWGGPLCVIRVDFTQAQLHAAQAQVEHDTMGGKLGDLQITSTGRDDVHNALRIGVVVVHLGDEAALSERYGVKVILFGALEPVP